MPKNFLIYLNNIITKLPFLQKEVQLLNFLHKLSNSSTFAQFRTSDIDKELKNCFINLNTGKELYFTDEGWNYLYALLLKNKEYNYTDPSKDLDDSIAYVMMNNNPISSDTNSFHLKAMSNIVTNIKENKVSSSSFITVLQHLFRNSNSSTISTNFLILYYKHFLITKNRKKELFEFPLTSTAARFGTEICQCIILEHPLFKKINLTLKNYTSKISANTIEDMDQFILYIESILNNDIIQENLYYAQIADFNLKNKKLISLIRNYLLIPVLEQFKNKTLPFAELNSLLHKNIDKFNLNELKIKHNENCIILGDLLIHFFIDEKLFKAFTKKLGKNKTQRMLTVDLDLVNNLLNDETFNIPYLNMSNMAWLEGNQQIDRLYSMVYENKKNFIHTNLDMSLTIKENSYLNSYKPHTYYSIDSNNLKFVLNMFEKILDEDVTNEEKELIIITILSLYDIDYYELKKKVAINDSEAELYDIVIKSAFILDFNVSSKFITDSNHPKKKILLETLNIINSYKIYIIGLLKEGVLLSCFKYIIHDGFIDTRARYYNSSIFTNPQANPTSKIIIKPYSYYNDINKSNYSIIKNIVKNNLKYAESKEKIDFFNSFTSYKEEEHYLRKEYLISYLKIDSQLFDLLMPLLARSFDDFAGLSMLYPIIKKRKKVLYIYTSILLYKNPNKYYNNYYELDACCSGLQLTSFLFQVPNLAYHCNLIGIEKTDIYMKANEKFFLALTNILTLRKNFISVYLPDVLEEAYLSPSNIKLDREAYLNLKTPENKFIALLNMNLYSSTYIADLLQDVSKIITNEMGEVKVEDYDKWIITTADKNLFLLPSIKHRVSEDIFNYFIIINKTHFIYKLIVKYNWLMLKLQDNRDLFKNAVMTSFYNATSYGRKEIFLNLLFKYQGNNENIQDMTSIAVLLNDFFEYFMKAHVPDSKRFSNLSQIISKTTKPIGIENKNFQIVFFPKKSITYILQTQSYKKQRGAQLTLTKFSEEIDPTLIKSRFNPNFIHSMDAAIVHNYIEFNMILNSTFIQMKHNLIFNYYTNHDTFGSTIPVFLKIIIEDCYRDLNDSQYINSLNNIDEELLQKIKSLVNKDPLDLSKMNPHFIK